MSTGSLQPFRPSTRAGTVTLAAGTTAASATLPNFTAAGTMPSAEASLLVLNTTAAVAFVRFDGNPATPNDLPVPPGGSRLLDIGSYASNASAILASGTGNVFFTRGSGSSY